MAVIAKTKLSAEWAVGPVVPGIRTSILWITIGTGNPPVTAGCNSLLFHLSVISGTTKLRHRYKNCYGNMIVLMDFLQFQFKAKQETIKLKINTIYR